jgi:DNA mismatch repair protein MutS
LAAIHAIEELLGIVTLDLAGGRFSLIEAPNLTLLNSEIERLRPAEILISENSTLTFKKRQYAANLAGILI